MLIQGLSRVDFLRPVDAVPLVQGVGFSSVYGRQHLGFGQTEDRATRGRAMGLTIGPFVAMVFFWKPVVVGLYYAVYRTLPGIEAAEWYLFAKRLNPLEAYRVLVGRVLDEPVRAVPHLPLEGATDLAAALVR
ncbi:hypothetical protein ACYJ1Y_13700 [Natrialbaceae archaeon A-gly3]